MDISIKTIKLIITITLIIFPIFMALYYKKGNGKNVFDYINAILSYFMLAFILLFDYVFIKFGIEVILDKEYTGIILVLFGLFMLYQVIKGIFALFNVNIKIGLLSNFNSNISVTTIVTGIFIVCFGVGSIFILTKIVPTTKGNLIDKIPLILVGCIFLLISIFSAFLWYDLFNKDKRGIKKANTYLKIGMIISTLFGLTFFFIGLRGLYNFDKGYIKTSGIYESKEIYSIPDDEGITYSLIYSYEVNGEKYYIQTDYGTSIIPKKGSTVNIYYNPKNPNEAKIIGDKTSYIAIGFGIIFIIVPPLIFRANKKAIKH